MDMFSINNIDNTTDIAGFGGSSSAWFDKLKTFATPVEGGSLTPSKLTPAEVIMKNAQQGKSSASILDAIPGARTVAETVSFWTDIPRLATVTVGVAFVVIAIAAIAFGSAPHLETALPKLAARIS